jgi:pSer/pThr/pTyr-binding forkhead associated (FHA) protein
MATTDLTLDAGQLTAALSEPPALRTFLVIHVEGEAASSTVIDVPEGGEVTIGRSRGATIVVDHEKVSRIHARFRRYGDRLDVEDLESRNGTRVNGDKIEGLRALTPGDEISVTGHTPPGS